MSMDWTDCKGLWKMVKIYDGGNHLLNVVKLFYNGATPVIKVGGYKGASFELEVGVRQDCIMVLNVNVPLVPLAPSQEVQGLNSWPFKDYLGWSFFML